MDLLSGTPFWPTRNGLIASYPPLARAERCEVAVIGGGVTGACIAHELAVAGHDVVVLDARDIGMGSTAGSTSLLQYDLDTPLAALAARIGEQPAARAFRLCADAVERIGRLAAQLPDPCGFQRSECLYGASSARDVPGFRAEYALRRRHGLAVQYWDRARVAASGTLPFHAALVSRPAAEIDAHRFTHALLRAAVRRGARVYDRTLVRRCRPTRTGVALTTDRGVAVRARWVVIAAGYEAASFLRLRGVRLHSTYALVSEPLAAWPGWPGRRMIWESARPYFYLRRTGDHRMMIGGGDEPFVDPRRRDELLPEKVGLLRRRFHRWFPRIPLEPAYAWAGTFAESKDGLPFIGPRPGFPRTLFALAYGGNGVTFAAVAAGLIRDFCAGKASADAALFRLDR